MPKPVSFPFPIRANLPVNSAFGKRPLYGDFHSGVDFNSTTGVYLNSPVRAAGAGRVVESYDGNSPGQSNWAKLRGTMVRIDHGGGWWTRYHMLQPDSNIPVGTVVRAGDIIGRVGNSGSSGTGAHLHFELWYNGVAINPVGQLTYNPAAFATTGGNGSTPLDNDPDSPATPINPLLHEDEMIRIQAPNRGIALIGAGYFRALATTEEVQQSEALMTKHITGNDRQYDIWVSLATGGNSATTYADKDILLNAQATTVRVTNVDRQLTGADGFANSVAGRVIDIQDRVGKGETVTVDTAAIVSAVVAAVQEQLAGLELPPVVIDVEAIAKAVANEDHRRSAE